MHPCCGEVQALSGLKIAIATGPSGYVTVKSILDASKQSGTSRLDWLETGLAAAEADETLHDVGVGGLPDALGRMSLDAAIMDGPSHRAGAVAGLLGFRSPIAVARRVMERTPHVMLVGEGAKRFAEAQGFSDEGALLTDYSRERYEAFLRGEVDLEATGDQHIDGGDTVGAIVMDTDALLACGTSTSGLAFKMPGRVGDSPIIGGGLYVEQGIGSAVCLGMGEQMMQVGMAMRTVTKLAQGMSPQAAAEAAMRDMIRLRPSCLGTTCLVIALNQAGDAGGARTKEHPDFHYWQASPTGVIKVEAPVMGN